MARVGVWPFLQGLMLSVLVGAGCVAFLNWWQSPFAAFHPFLPPISQRQPGAVLEADREMQMRWLLQQAQSASAHTLLIGSSQMLIGMDTCASPSVGRLGLFFLTDAEIVKLLHVILPRLAAPTTFVIQEGLVTPEAPPSTNGRLRRLWRDLLSQETTQASLMNLYMSLVPGRPPCAALEYSLNVPNAKSPAVIHKLLSDLGTHLAPPSALSDVLHAVEPSCARFHHTVVIVKLPVMFTPAEEPELMAMEARQRQVAHDALAAFNSRGTGCKVLFRDFATPYTQANAAHGADPADWYDPLHFKPELGQKLLHALLATAQDSPDGTAGR